MSSTSPQSSWSRATDRGSSSRADHGSPHFALLLKCLHTAVRPMSFSRFGFRKAFRSAFAQNHVFFLIRNAQLRSGNHLLPRPAERSFGKQLSLRKRPTVASPDHEECSPSPLALRIGDHRLLGRRSVCFGNRREIWSARSRLVCRAIRHAEPSHRSVQARGAAARCPPRHIGPASD